MSTDYELERQLLRRGDALPWHQHCAGYAAIVVEGGYEEAGDEGRLQVSAADVIIHPPFSAHVDRIAVQGATVFNLPLSARQALTLPSGRVVDPERLLRDLCQDSEQAAAILAAALIPIPRLGDLPDALAAAISHDPMISVARWSATMGASDRTMRRHFSLAYGVTPKHFRARAKAKRAWERIAFRDDALIDIALEAGFADQAHMSRAVLSLTGRSPKHWRLADAFKTGRAGPL